MSKLYLVERGLPRV